MNDLHSMIVNILPAAKVTAEITFGAWVLSILLGAALATIHVQGGWLTRWGAVGFVYLLRSVPPLIGLYIIFYGLPTLGLNLSPIKAAIVGLGVLDGVYSAEYYRAAFTTIGVQQWEAALGLGMSTGKSMRLVVIPQTIPFVIPPIINSLVGMMKVAVYASAIGAPELLFTGENYMANTGKVTEVAIFIMGVYLIATIPLTRLAAHLERRVREAYG